MRGLAGTGRENKLESLRELVGGGKATGNMAKGSTKDWLDPHCMSLSLRSGIPSEWNILELFELGTMGFSFFFSLL